MDQTIESLIQQCYSTKLRNWPYNIRFKFAKGLYDCWDHEDIKAFLEKYDIGCNLDSLIVILVKYFPDFTLENMKRFILNKKYAEGLVVLELDIISELIKHKTKEHIIKYIENMNEKAEKMKESEKEANIFKDRIGELFKGKDDSL